MGKLHDLKPLADLAGCQNREDLAAAWRISEGLRMAQEEEWKRIHEAFKIRAHELGLRWTK